ncbi:hypothetical protein Cgig2_004416 [Carnegiea gigantea]|uniref:Uncharacterized protein n=1 Tax=Carnegiea gigantea TaxID=171969 RepID=A0A9Q1JYJ6_9CARY|nr:hypothetical protein Cgig2_004416 [Carnegiea gigantea]
MVQDWTGPKTGPDRPGLDRTEAFRSAKSPPPSHPFPSLLLPFSVLGARCSLAGGSCSEAVPFSSPSSLAPCCLAGQTASGLLLAHSCSSAVFCSSSTSESQSSLGLCSIGGGVDCEFVNCDIVLEIWTNFTNLWLAVLIRNCLGFMTLALIFLVPNVNQSDAMVPPDILGSKSSSKSDADKESQLVPLAEKIAI